MYKSNLSFKNKKTMQLPQQYHYSKNFATSPLFAFNRTENTKHVLFICTRFTNLLNEVALSIPVNIYVLFMESRNRQCSKNEKLMFKTESTIILLRGIHIKWNQLSKIFCFSSEKRSSLKRNKNVLPKGKGKNVLPKGTCFLFTDDTF